MLVGLVQVDARTSTGTTDLTVSGYGTCKGAILWVTRATANASAATHYVFGMGATDGTRDRCFSTSSEDALSDTNTFNRAKTGKCLMLINPADGSIDGEVQFDSFITDGIRINTTDAFGSAYKIEALLFFGSDCQMYVGDFDTTSGNVDVTAPNFTPNGVCVFGPRAPIDDTGRASARYSIGWAHWNGSTVAQFSINGGEDDGAAAGQTYLRPESAKVTTDVQNATVGGDVTLSTFDSQGFTAVQGNSAGFPCMFAAIKFDNNADLRQYGTRTASGTFNHTESGKRPHAVFGHMTWIRTTNTTNEANLSGTWGLWGFTSDTNEFCASVQAEDGASTTNTQSYADNVALALPLDSGASMAYVANCTAILSNGFTLDYTTPDSNNRIFVGFLIQTMVFTGTMSVVASAATVALDVDKLVQAPQFAADVPSGLSQVFSGASGNDISGGDTWEIWIKADTWQTSMLFARWSTLGTKLYHLSVSNAGVLTWQVGNGGATVSTPALSTGRWYQVFVTYDENDKITIRASEANARQFGTLTSVSSGVPTIPAGNQTLVVGTSALSPSSSFDGLIQRFRHYDTSLDATSQETLFNGGRGYTTREMQLAQAGIFGALTYSYDMTELSSGAIAVPRREWFGGLSTALTDHGLIPSAQGWGTVMLPSPATVSIDIDKIAQTSPTVSAGAATTAITGRPVRQAGQLAALFNSSNTEVLKANDQTWDLNFDNDFNEFTFECWVRPDGVDTIIFGLWGASSADQQYALVYDGVSFVVWFINDGSSLDSVSSSVPVTQGQWYHVVFTLDFNGGDFSIYVNLVQDSTSLTGSGPFTVSDPTEFYVGGDVSAPRYWDGAITGLRRWNRILTQGEITDLYFNDDGQDLAGVSAQGLFTDATHLVEMLEYSDGSFPVTRVNWRQPGIGDLLDTSDTVPSTAGRLGFFVNCAPATSTFDADVIRQTVTFAVSAGAATTAISGTVYHSHGPVVANADNATTAIAAQLIHQASMTISAADATVSITTQFVHQTSMTVSAEAASVVFDADLVRQTTLTLSAGDATVAIDADKIAQASVAVSAGAATTAIDSQLVHQTSVACSADDATTAIAGQKRMHVTMAIDADAATTAIDSQLVHQTSVATTADAATTAIAAQRVVQTTVTATADAATTAIDGEVDAGGALITTDVAVSAGAATVALDADVIRQTSVAVSAGAATTAIDSQLVHQTSTAASADAATTSIAGQRVSTASMAIDAGAATTAIAAQLVHQTTVAVSAGLATVAISAEIVGIISADVDVSAGAATTAIAAQLIHQTTLTCSAGAATTAVPTQRVPQTSMAVAAGAATASIDGSVFQVTGTVSASAGAATVALAAQRIPQAALALQAGAATAALDADRIAQASVSVSAGAATAALDADRVVQTTATLQAGAATVSISGTVVQVSGSVTAQAGAATAAIAGQVIRQTALALQAAPSTTAVLAQRVVQAVVVAQCAPATVVIAAGLNVTADVALAAGPATVVAVAQRVIQTTVAVQASPARAQALEVVVPSLIGPPAIVFEMQSSHDVVMPELFADLFFYANNKLVVSAIAVQASPATVSISGVVL